MLVTHSLADASLPPRSTCVALGLFDGLHLGHRAVLEESLAAAGQLSLEPVCFTFTTGNRAPAAKAGFTRLMSSPMMSAMLEEMGFTRMLCPDFDEFRELSPGAFVQILAERLGAGSVVCGYDFRFGKNAAAGSAELISLCDALGLDCRIVSAVEIAGEPVASRRIRELVRAGELPAANRLLGRCFAIDFKVVHGRRLGRGLGFPTINQPFPQGFTLPRFGVYATLIPIGDRLYSGVTNVGVKPTVGSDGALAETYIEGYEGDLYGREVEVRFLQFLREEQKFPSLEALRERITADAAQARGIAREFL